MEAVLKKAKGQCTTPEKMLQFRVKIIAVASCVLELGRLKKERKKERRRKKKSGDSTHAGLPFLKR